MRLLIVVSLASAVVAAQAPVRRYEVRRASAPPTIDGKLDDAEWGTAPAVTLQFLSDPQNTESWPHVPSRFGEIVFVE